MKVIKTIGNCCLIFLTVIAMMVTIATKWTLDIFKSTHQHDTENNRLFEHEN